jgi:DNA-binding XRE family transcriptional regulator
MTLAEQFGRNVFMARRLVGVTQEALAKMAGLHRGTVYLLEDGRRSPGLETIVKLADALGIRPCELMKGLWP